MQSINGSFRATAAPGTPVYIYISKETAEILVSMTALIIRPHNRAPYAFA